MQMESTIMVTNQEKQMSDDFVTAMMEAMISSRQKGNPAVCAKLGFPNLVFATMKF